MKNKIKAFIKELPTIRQLKRQIKALENELDLQQDEIDNQAKELVEIQDKDTSKAKIQRLEDVLVHYRQLVKTLREENKRLREE